jgi:hypothetical protein
MANHGYFAGRIFAPPAGDSDFLRTLAGVRAPQ